MKCSDSIRFCTASHCESGAKRALSICFRYWLAHYFRKDREKFRRYVDKFYPTLRKWLEQDFYENDGVSEGFFGPLIFWERQGNHDVN